MDYSSFIIIPKHSRVYKTMEKLAADARVVCFSGLPAVGKSLCIQQFSYLALAAGRQITTLQWDRARQSFETEELLKHFPESDGITHPAIRKACGLWARKAVYEWSKDNHNSNSLLIIEAPLIGNRLVELAVPYEDESENFLQSALVQFVIPVPAPHVRAAIEARRKKTSVNPQHVQEKADANPFVVAVLSRELNEVAVRLGYKGSAQWFEYDPELYEYVYREVLKFRNTQVLSIDFLMDKTDSVYSFAGSDQVHMVPGAQAVSESIGRVALLFPSPEALQSAVDDWYWVEQSH